MNDAERRGCPSPRGAWEREKGTSGGLAFRGLKPVATFGRRYVAGKGRTGPRGNPISGGAIVVVQFIESAFA
jgi:hypothetical protein